MSGSACAARRAIARRRSWRRAPESRWSRRPSSPRSPRRSWPPRSPARTRCSSPACTFTAASGPRCSTPTRMASPSGSPRTRSAATIRSTPPSRAVTSMDARRGLRRWTSCSPGSPPARRPDRTPGGTPPRRHAHPFPPGERRGPWSAARPEERARPLEALAERLEAEAPALARALATEIGKPVTLGEAEVRRTAELLRRAAALRLPGPSKDGPASCHRRVPLGVVAVVTPWNNPLAIPVGQDRPGAGSRQHGGLEAGPRRDPARGAHARRGARGGSAGRSRDARSGRSPRGRRRDERSGSGRGLRVGLFRGRLGGAGNLRAPPHPDPGGARRQQRRDRLGRRGPAARGQSPGSGSVRVRGPALYGEPASRRGGSPPLHAPRASLRGRGDAALGRSARPGDASRSSRVRRGARPGRRRARGRGRRRGAPGHAPHSRAESAREPGIPPPSSSARRTRARSSRKRRSARFS